MDYSRVERNWGHYKVLYEGDDFVVKELVINPHSSLSMQRHQYRSETWNLVKGNAYIKTLRNGLTLISELTNTESVHIPIHTCLLYTSPSPRDRTRSRMPSSA